MPAVVCVQVPVNPEEVPTYEAAQELGVLLVVRPLTLVGLAMDYLATGMHYWACTHCMELHVRLNGSLFYGCHRCVVWITIVCNLEGCLV